MVPSLALLLHVGADLSPRGFSVHISTVIGILALVALYEGAAQRVDRGTQPGPRRSQRWCFYVGLVVLFFSLNGWLHDLSDFYLFSAHMVQHLLLALAVAPLLIMGTPGWMLRPALRVPAVTPVARFLTRPTHAFVIFNVVVAAWHLPVLYNLAMAEHPVHIVMHLMFLVVSVLMWWPILSPMPELPRLSYPLQMLYLFLMSIPMSIVAIFIAYAGEVLYPAYASAPRIWGLSPLTDQFIGGLIMWIPGGLFFVAVLSVVFFKWQSHDALDSADAAQVDWIPSTHA
jgi:putative membrane protein